MPILSRILRGMHIIFYAYFYPISTLKIRILIFINRILYDIMTERSIDLKKDKLCVKSLIKKNKNRRKCLKYWGGINFSHQQFYTVSNSASSVNVLSTKPKLYWLTTKSNDVNATHATCPIIGVFLFKWRYCSPQLPKKGRCGEW